MNREDIIGIATKSWLTEYGRTLLLRGFDIEINIEELERFFHMAYNAGAAAEREECAKVVDDCDIKWWENAANLIRARGNT